MAGEQASFREEAAAEVSSTDSKLIEYDRKRAPIAPIEELIADVCICKDPFQYLDAHEMCFLIEQLDSLTNELLEHPLDVELCKKIAEDVRKSIDRVGHGEWPCVIDYLKVLMTNIRAAVKSLHE